MDLKFTDDENQLDFSFHLDFDKPFSSGGHGLFFLLLSSFDPSLLSHILLVSL
jgi:hypothetical protein